MRNRNCGWAKLVALGALGALQGCAGLLPEKRIDDLDPPGFFDIGVGYGVIFGASGTESNDDADGILASFKGYPLGRWYSTQDVQKGLKKVQGGLMTPRLQQVLSLVEEVDKATNQRITKVRRDVKVPSETGLTIVMSDVIEKAGKKGDKLEGFTRGLIDVPDVELAKDLTKGEELVMFLPEGANVASIAAQISDVAERDKYVVVVNEKAKSSWYHRVSVFYGVSVGKFSGGGVDASANAFGFGFDITPEMSVLGGRAYFKRTVDGVEDADNEWFFGMSLNLNAFRSLVSATTL